MYVFGISMLIIIAIVLRVVDNYIPFAVSKRFRCSRRQTGPDWSVMHSTWLGRKAAASEIPLLHEYLSGYS